MHAQVDQQLQADTEGATPTPEPGSEDEAIALLNQRAQSKAADQGQLTDEPAEEPEDGNQEGDPGEGDPQEDLDEVELEGKTYRLPKAVKDAVLRKADYSRHVQEVTAQKKDYAQRIEAVELMVQGAQEYAKALAKVHELDAQLKQFETVDFDRLETEDPARASVLALRLMRLQQAREKAATDAQGVSKQLAESRAKDVNAKRQDMFKALAKDFPGGWTDEAGAKVTKTALAHGWTEAELTSLTDPRLVLILEKARKFDAIQEGRAKALDKAKDAPPVAKPGAPRRVDQRQEALQRFQKTGSPDDAIAVFQAMAAARR